MTSLSLLLLQNTLPDLPVGAHRASSNRGGIWRISVPLSQRSGVFASQSHNLDSSSLQARLTFERLGNSVRGFMGKSNTRALKPKKIQTATMKRRSLKAKFIEAAPRKARSLQVRAAVISPIEPPGV
jgi:hypothetical protein